MKKENAFRLNLGEVTLRIIGNAPMVQNRFSHKAVEMMREKQSLGSAAKKGAKRPPKDFEANYEGSKHVSEQGWCGISAPAFRSAIISACRLVGFKMTLAKLSVFVIADGVDKYDGTPLVRITKGEPHKVEHYVRLATGVADIASRAMWDAGWEAVLRIRFDADQFQVEDVVQLVARAGMQVGIGAGHPDSKESAGQGWGTFNVTVEG